MQATLHHIEHLTDRIHTFWFIPERPLRYSAGQFIEMQLDHDHQDDRGNKRWFTISSSPTEDMIAITTKQAATLSSSFKKHLFALRPGDRVIISEAMGDFVLPIDTSIPLVFVAAGIGITPIRSMITYLTDTNQQRDIRILYSGRTVNDLVYSDLLISYKAQVTLLTSENQESQLAIHGHITSSLILDQLQAKNDRLIYISGPEQMVEQLQKQLLKSGIDDRKLVLDFFPNYNS